MGKVRTSTVKIMAMHLMEQYGEKFTKDFVENKRLISTLTTIKAKHLRNRVAGYITRMVNKKLKAQESMKEKVQEAVEGGVS